MNTSAFYLPKPDRSIFLEIETREYPDMPLMYGFINKQMGIKLRKNIATLYSDEHTHYKNYIGEYNHDEEFIKTRYTLPAHGWGRVNANRSLTMSVFHRSSRHSFAQKNYLDFDIKNAHPQFMLGFAKKDNLPLTGGLEEYCNDPELQRKKIAEYYDLKDKIDDEGVKLTALEQAKKLPLRLSYGGGVTKWKSDFIETHNHNKPEMPLITKLIIDFERIRDKVVETNPHIRNDLQNDLKMMEDWSKKTEHEKSCSIMSFYAQTWERIIQEYCISHIVRQNRLSLGDIIPSQDGFMPLKKVVEDNKIDIPDLFETFTSKVFKKYGIQVKWKLKEFDEAIFIKPSDEVPIYLTYKILFEGETTVSRAIYPALKKQLYYNSTKDIWYYTDNKNIWCKTKKCDNYLVSTTIQKYIRKLIHENFKKTEEITEDDETKKNAKSKKLLEEKKFIEKQISAVGKSSYLNQVITNLRILLRDNDFEKKLDDTTGKIVFADGIFNLKTGIMKYGIKKDDYVTFTLSVKYPPTFDLTKMEYLKNVVFKKILNWNDTHLEYYLSILGYGFTGDSHLEKSIYYIIDGTEGKGDNGKTFIWDILTSILPEYVKSADSTLLEDCNTKSHKQIPVLDGKRWVWLDEGTKKKLNAKLMKKVGDGKTIDSDVLFGNSTEFKVSYKMAICSNHIPKISKDEDAVYNRYKQIQFNSHFDRTGEQQKDDYETLNFIADSKLGDIIKKDYKEEIINLILEYAMKYYIEGIPDIPLEFIEAVKKTKSENNEFMKWFRETYEKTNEDDRVSIDSIENETQFKRDEILKELKNMGVIFNKTLSFGTKKIYDKGVEKVARILGGFKGYRKIEDEVENGETDEEKE